MHRRHNRVNYLQASLRYIYVISLSPHVVIQLFDDLFHSKENVIWINFSDG